MNAIIFISSIVGFGLILFIAFIFLNICALAYKPIQKDEALNLFFHTTEKIYYKKMLVFFEFKRSGIDLDSEFDKGKKFYIKSEDHEKEEI